MRGRERGRVREREGERERGRERGLELGAAQLLSISAGHVYEAAAEL